MVRDTNNRQVLEAVMLAGLHWYVSQIAVPQISMVLPGFVWLLEELCCKPENIGLYPHEDKRLIASKFSVIKTELFQ